MGLRNTLLVLTPVFFLFQTLSAQSDITVALKGDVQRIPTVVYPGKNRIQLCGLTPEHFYRVIGVPMTRDQKLGVRVTMVSPLLEEHARAVSRADRPQMRQFKAPSDCVELYLEVEGGTPGNGEPFYLSTACLDCDTEDKWLKNFQEKAEGILANLATVGGVSASSLVTNTLIGGNCFDVSGITSSGHANSRGTFSNGATNINIASGAVMCTGNVSVLPGPNNANNASGNTAGFNVNSADDPDLATLSTGNQWDVSKIEFDFKPTANMVQFDFVFGSDEYCEYVNSQYNDVFGFFISGPGFSGPTNIALLPNGNTPVAINNVNHLTNTSYYVNNNNWNPCTNMGMHSPTECQLDGWTTVLTATANVIPCSTYHIKLAIADIADGAYASAVFLKANSFNAGGVVKAQPVYPAGQQYVIEGCNNGFIKFVRSGGDPNEPITVNFGVGGTATPGDDYDPLGNSVTIPGGQTEVLIPINVFTDLLTEGNETITITLENSCTCNQQTMTFNIHDKLPLEIEMEDKDQCGGNGVTLAPTIVSAGQAPLTYAWSNNATTPSITVTTPGTNTYTVTVTDACGETKTAESTVTYVPQPTASISGSGVLCAGAGGSVNLTITMTGLGPWDVEISHGGNTETQTFSTSPATYTATEPGTYTLTSVTSPGGCTGTVSGSATITEVTVDVNVNSTDPSCFGSNNGSITASASGGNGPFTYSWDNGPTGPTQNNLPPGTYTVTATNAQGCTGTETVTLEEPPQLTASIAGSTNIDCNNPIGNADLDVDGGTPGYSFNWSNGLHVEDPTFTAGGTYTVTVTDTKNCTVTTSVTITANTTLPVAVAQTPPPINCINSTITINATGSSQGSQFSYEWDGPGLVCCETTLEPQVNAGGTYTLTVTNNENGCTKTVTVTVVENITPPIANINTPQNIGCNLPVVTLNGAGSSTGSGITYQWSTSDGNFVCCTTTLTPQVNQAGTYTLVVTNGNNGCTAEASVTVNGNTDPPTATIEPPGIVDCNNPEIELDASGSSQGGNFSYNWSASGGGNFTCCQTTLNPMINQGGTYTLTVTNADNNCTATASVTVTANLTPPTAVANGSGTITCANPTLTLNGNGSSTGSDFSYEWTANPGNIVSGENTLNPVVDQGGTYTLLVTNNANGCTASASVSVNENLTPPNANAGPPLELNCLHTTWQLQGSGSTGPNIGIQWTANPGNITSGANTYTPTVNEAGTYTLVVTNNTNGCTAEDQVTITANFDTPTASIAPPEVVNCNTPEIELDGSGSSQGGNITYNWNTTNGHFTGGTNTSNPTVNQGGTYYLTVTDTDSGCTATASVTVTQNTTLPVAVANVSGVITCLTPEITINGSGSSTGPDFSYEWTANPGNIVSGENTLNPVVDQAGTYTLVVTNNANGCTKQVSVNVNSNTTPPNANAGPSLELNCLHTSLQLQGSGSTGAPGYTVQWTANPGNIVSGANTYSPTVNQAGTYTLVVTNTSNGCTAEDEVVVTENFNVPTASVEPPEVVNCYTPEVELDGSGSSQGNNFTYNWSTTNGHFTGGTNTSNPTVNQGGTYYLTVTDTDSGCTATTSVTVTQNTAQPVAVATATGILTCQNQQMTLNGNGSSTGPEFTYEWTANPGNIVSGENTLNPVVDQPGTYTLLVTNTANGCTKQVSVNVTSNQDFPNANAGQSLELNCLHQTVQLQGSGSSGPPGYSVQWTANPGNIISGGNTYSPTVNQPGTYTLVVTNTANGCTAEDEVEVTANFNVPTASVEPPGVVNCYTPEIELDGSGSSQGSNITYQWSTNNGHFTGGTNTSNPTVNQGGTYYLTVTDTDSGCTATTSVTVTQNLTLPVAVASVNGILTCQNPEITLNGTGSSTGSNFSYEWTTTNGNIVSGETTLNPVVDQPGTYTLVVTNNENGCTKTANVTVTSNQNFPSVSAGPALELNCVHPTWQLQGSGSSGPGYTIQWTANPGNITSGANTYTPTVNQPGTYYLVVTNTANGCTADDFVEVTANFNVPDAVIAPPDIINCYNPTIDLDAGASSQGNNFQFNWSTPNGHFVSGQNSPYPTIDQGGTYNLTVTDTESGCTATASVVVLKNTTHPTANAGAPATLSCTISQLTLNGSGTTGPNFTIEWNTSNGNIVSGENTLNPVVDQAGTYFLVITNDVNGCTAQSSVTIQADQNAPVAYAGGDAQLTCTNPTVKLSGSGSSTGSNYTYQWVANPGNIVSGANTLNNAVVNAYGYYTLIVTNTQNGCTDEDEVFVDDNIIYPQADILPAQQLNCTFPSVQLDAGGSSQGNNFNYTWTTVNGHIVTGNGTPYPEVDKIGTYNLLITNTDNGCTATASVTVSQDFAPPVASAVPTATITCQAPQTQLNGQGSSSGYPFFYEWTTTNGNIVSGHLTLTPVVNQTGSYTLTVFNVDNGCTAQATVQVTAAQTFPTANAGPAQTLTCATQQVTLNGTGSSQGSQYNYVWSTQNGYILSGANTLNPVVNAPGTYDLVVINTQTGCTSVASVAVDQNTANPVAVAAPGGQLSCTVTALTLDGTASSAGANMAYSWTTVNGVIVSGQTTLNPVVNAVGVYTLIVTNNANGCTASASTTVTADASLPAANAGPPDTLNCLVSQLTLNGDASSQGSQYAYAWTGPSILSGATTLNPVVNQAGVYELLVTNTSNGCTAISNVTIPADLVLPLAEAGPSALLSCTDTLLTLDGSPSSAGQIYTYAWAATSGGHIASGANTPTPKVDQPGTYTLLVTNTANGCTASDAVDIPQNIVHPTANAGPPGLITCTNATVTLSGTGSTGPQFSYLWTTLNGSIASGDSTLTPVVDAPGLYNLLITNTVNNCTATASVQVNKDANVPIATAQAPGELTCAVTQMQLNGAGSSTGPAMQYSWTTANGNILSGANTLTPTINAPGQYSLAVFNTANNCQALFSVNVNENLTPPVASAGAPAVLSCTNPVLTLDGSGSSQQGAQFTYQWSTADGKIVSGANTLSPKVDHSGLYQLVVTDTQNGCTASATVQILLDQNSPEADAGPAMAITCTASTVTLNGAGSTNGPNFTFQWTAASGGNILSGANTLSPVVDAPGQYTLLVTNPANGCTSIASTDVTVDKAPPLAVVAPPQQLNCQLIQTTLNTSGSSTGGNFTYKWTTAGGSIQSGANSPAPVVNKPGTYNLVITNLNNGCTATASVAVTQDVAVPAVDAGPAAELNCTVKTLTLGGTAGNTSSNTQYLWSTANGNIVSGGNTLAPVVDQPGVYLLTVTNLDNHCTAMDQVPISQNIVIPLATAAAGPVLTCTTLTAALNGNGSSTGPLFTYQWQAQGGGNILSGANTLLPSVNAPGVYALTVTNTNNTCTATTSVTVTQNITPPNAVAGNPVTLTCTSPSLSLNGTGSSAGSQFSYQWSTLDGNILTGANTLQPTIGAPGLYTLLVTDQVNGCTKEASVQVQQDANAPIAAAATPGELTCKVTVLNLSGTGSSTGPNFSYQWTTPDGKITGGAATLSPSVTAPGAYNLLVTNKSNGCTETASVTVTQNITPPTVSVNTTGTITCAVPQLSLIGAASGSGQGLDYAWTTSNGAIVSGSATPNPVVNAGGLYTLTVTDLYNGCTNTGQVLVPADQQAPAAVIAPPGILTCLVFTVNLNATGSAQGSQYVYSWNGPGIVSGAGTLLPVVNLPGTYLLQITNSSNGCTASTSTVVKQDAVLPVAEAGTGFELTCSVTEGVLDASASTFGPNIVYQWSTSDGNILTGNTSIAPEVNAPGIYNLLVTNKRICSKCCGLSRSM